MGEKGWEDKECVGKDEKKKRGCCKWEKRENKAKKGIKERSVVGEGRQ